MSNSLLETSSGADLLPTLDHDNDFTSETNENPNNSELATPNESSTISNADTLYTNKRSNLSVDNKISIINMIRSKKYTKKFLMSKRSDLCFGASKSVLRSLYRLEERHKEKPLDKLKLILQENMSKRGRKPVVTNFILNAATQYINQNPRAAMREVVDYLKSKFPSEKIPARTTLNKAVIETDKIYKRLTLVSQPKKQNITISSKENEQLKKLYTEIARYKNDGYVFMMLGETKWDCKTTKNRSKNGTKVWGNFKVLNSIFSVALCFSENGIEFAVLADKNESKKKADIICLFSDLYKKITAAKYKVCLIVIENQTLHSLFDCEDFKLFKETHKILTIDKNYASILPSEAVFAFLIQNVDSELQLKAKEFVMMNEKFVAQVIEDKIRKDDTKKHCILSIIQFFNTINENIDPTDKITNIPKLEENELHMDVGGTNENTLTPESLDNVALK